MDRGLDPAYLRALGLGWWYSPAFLAQPDRVEEALAWQDPYPAPAHGIAARAAAARAHDALDRLPRIAAPTLVLVGTEDVVTPVYDARELAAGIPRGAGAGGHSALWECPEAGAEALLAFLAG